jgi:iron complex outermembrane recepter protein
MNDPSSSSLLTLRHPFAMLLLACATTSAACSEARAASQDLADLSIEELMDESITSVAKKEQRIGQASAAIYVLTGDEILRAGHTTIPEALRMVPGLSVARLDSHSWIITARGFAAQWAGKLLVLVDGRTVYDPFFSGVIWSNQDLPLENLDRIEVIRGPGATLWGANAVNGVINIITKKARDTQGGLVALGAGNGTHGGTIQYGGRSTNTQYRAYFKYDGYADSAEPPGYDVRDDWRMWRTGFRADWQASAKTAFTVQGDLYTSAVNTLNTATSLQPPHVWQIPNEQDVSGANLVGRWIRTIDERSHASVQLYYDRTDSQQEMFSIRRDIVDIEFQHERALGSRHTIVYGAGYRFAQAAYTDSLFLTYPREHDSMGLANAFLQDEIALAQERLTLSLGSKIEHNEFSGTQLQPSVRLLWSPDHEHSVWTSISRAVRTPNPVETALRVNYAAFDMDGSGSAPTTLMALVPNPALGSEKLIAYEAGYRVQPNENLFLDVATFVNVYDDLVTLDDAGLTFETNPSPQHLLIASRYTNKMRGETHGIEVAPSWQVNGWWKMTAAYTWLQMNLRSDAAGRVGEEQEGDSPRHQLHLRSSLQLPHLLSFDTALCYVDNLPNQRVSSYVRLDMRLGWRPTETLAVSLDGSNLLDERHAEFLSYAPSPSLVPRSIFGKLTWRF